MLFGNSLNPPNNVVKVSSIGNSSDQKDVFYKRLLPPKVTARRRYKQRATKRNRRRQRQDGRGFLHFIKKEVRTPAAKALEPVALKKPPFCFIT